MLPAVCKIVRLYSLYIAYRLAIVVARPEVHEKQVSRKNELNIKREYEKSSECKHDCVCNI